MSLGSNIYRLRTGRGLSQGDLAESLQVSRQSVSKWETDGAVPDLDKLLALSDLFGVTLDELVRGEIAEQAAAEVPTGEKARQKDAATGSSTAKTVLIVILVILALWLLFSLFMSPSLWPGLLILIVIGGLGFALWTRVREDQEEQAEQEGGKERTSGKNQLLKILLIAGVLLLPVLGLVNSQPAGPVYAKVGKESDISLHETPLVSVVDFYLYNENVSIHYALQNDSVQPMGFKPSDSRIEVKKDGKWHYLVKQPSDKVHGYIAMQHGEVQHSSIDFEKVYGGNLSPGEYRLLVQVFSEVQPSNIYWIAKEFTIQ